MNSSGLVNIKTVTVKKTRASNRRKDTSQVCRCTRASLCFMYLKKAFMFLGRSWWTHRLTPQNVCLCVASRQVWSKLQIQHPPLLLFDSCRQRVTGMNCSSNTLGPEKTQILAIPKAVDTILTPFLYSQVCGGLLILWFLLALSWTGWY